MIHVDSRGEITLRLDIEPVDSGTVFVHDYNWEKAAGNVYLSLKDSAAGSNPHVKVSEDAEFPFIKAAIIRRYVRQEEMD